jgi:hypothetical protein
MGSHDPFGHLKHRLWSKEGPEVNLAIWLLITKSRESTQFPCVQVVCHILLESSQWGLQRFFRPHLNRRSAEKVMGPQSHKSPKLENFETPTWESWTKAIWMWPPWKGVKYIIRGKVVASPKSGSWWVLWILWVQDCPWLILAPKVFQLCTNHLVLVLCRSVWVIEACQFFLIPSQSSSTPLYPSKVLRAREHAPTPRFPMFSACMGFTFESLKELAAR